jgi:uncharacterized protein (TIGR00369 family)
MPAQHFATSPADLPDMAALTAMSGLAFMQAMLDGRIPHPPIAGPMNYHLHSVEPGRVAFRGTAEFSHSNPMGTVHGGWYGTLLDSALGCAVMTTVPRGRTYTTLEYKVNIIRALPIGLEVEAHATIDHAGRSTAVAQGEIRGVADGRLYATGSTTCILLG